MKLRIYFENGKEMELKNCDKDTQEKVNRGYSVSRGGERLSVNMDKVLYTVLSQD